MLNWTQSHDAPRPLPSWGPPIVDATPVCAGGGCSVELPAGTTDPFCPTCRRNATMDTLKATDAVDPFPVAPGARLGDYEILEVVASGGMGVIFRARQVSLNRVVALKMILGGRLATPEDVHRFQIEAEAAASMDHPHIVPIYEVGQERGCHYFSMRLVEGTSLTKRIPEFVGDPRRAARLMAAVAKAVHYAHQRGILHRDLKPANVLLGPDDSPYLTDFGLARRIEGAQTVTQDGMVVGTPEYMAPEQALGERKAFTTAVDVYGLGAIFYELMTGRPPFRGASVLETLRHLIDREPARPRSLVPHVDADLETICLRCLEKSPARRYGSAEMLAQELESWLAGEPIRARPITTFERAVKWARRRPILAALVAVSALSVLLVLGGGVWFNRRLERELVLTEEARRELQVALTRQVAERLDGDLRQLSAIPQSLAVLLGRRPDWTEEQLHGCMGELLRVDERLFGICAAFEPSGFAVGRQDYALYYYRSSSGPAAKVLDPATYQPLYREWPWYQKAKEEQRPVWIEPFFDKGGGEIWMTTHAVPFARDGRFAGVVTVDVSIEAYVRAIRRWLDELNLGPHAYCFVLDQTGAIISHPERSYFRKGLAELCSLRELTDGSIRAIDSGSGKMSSFTSARVASSGWRFVVVVPEEPISLRTGRLSGPGGD